MFKTCNRDRERKKERDSRYKDEILYFFIYLSGRDPLWFDFLFFYFGKMSTKVQNYINI